MSTFLSSSERAFLHSQGLGPADVYDSVDLTRSAAVRLAEQAGCIIYLGSPCDKAGHRLRIRSGGHCIQCNTSYLKYASRKNQPGTVYIAASRAKRLIKIGMTADISDRERTLRRDAYAGASDWEVLAHLSVEKAGKFELSMQQRLSSYRVDEFYEKVSKKVKSGELFRCNFITALEAMRDAAQEARISGASAWLNRNYKDFNKLSSQK